MANDFSLKAEAYARLVDRELALQSQSKVPRLLGLTQPEVNVLLLYSTLATLYAGLAERSADNPKLIQVGWVAGNGCGEVIFRQLGNPDNDDAFIKASNLVWRPCYVKSVA